MADRTIITVELLRKLLTYDADTGVLYWRARDASMFVGGSRSPDWRAKSWNTKWAGKPALHCVNPYGYRAGAACGVTIMAHVAAYIVHNGKLPKGQVDHINGDRRDNRPDNLRDVSRAENMRNMARYKTNRSGTQGVHWDKGHKAWTATIGVNGRPTRIGRFKSMEAAIAARSAACIMHKYHPNAGRERFDRRRT